MKIKVMALAVIISSNAIAGENGFYLGGKVGVESVKSKMEYSTLSVDSFGNEGAIYGIVAGYNFPVSSDMYIGLEADIYSIALKRNISLARLKKKFLLVMNTD